MAKQLQPPDEKALKFSRERIDRAWQDLRKHVLIGPLVQRARLKIVDYQPQVAAMLTTVSSVGEVYANSFSIKTTQEEWTFALAHSLLHLAFGHVKFAGRGIVWNIACDCIVNEFLHRMRIGQQPEGFLKLPTGMPNDEDKLFAIWSRNGSPPKGNTTNGTAVDMIATGAAKANWHDIFARAIRRAAKESLAAAAGEGAELGPAHQARSWFIKNYPLLGAVAQHLKIVEDAKICERMGIRVAAVNPRRRELILNPGWAMEDAELRYVVAHASLHAGLMHAARRKDRDSFVWSVACDYCINGWLAKIDLLRRSCIAPKEGLLLSPLYDGRPPEEIYDELIANPKLTRKLSTFAGESLPDILGMDLPSSVSDRFLLDALLRGYQIHAESGKGPLPHTLLDEIRSLEKPPLPWDVVLAKWFDEHVPPVERMRTYGRPSRRQSSTPEIARPRYVWPDEEIAQRSTLGLVIDASGALPATMLTQVLGAISTYAVSRNVQRVRMVYTGGELRDLGPIAADEMLQHRISLPRSTPLLQPAVQLLDDARDFPGDAPILLISGMPPDRVSTQRTHAWLIPDASRLPYKTDATQIRYAEEEVSELETLGVRGG